MRLLVQGRPLDLSVDTSIKFKTDFSAKASTFSYSFQLPRTDNNLSLLPLDYYEPTEAILELSTTYVMQGEIYVVEYDKSSYTAYFVSKERSWVDLTTNTDFDISVPFDYSSSIITEYNTDKNSLLCFPLVSRGQIFGATLYRLLDEDFKPVPSIYPITAGTLNPDRMPYFVEGVGFVRVDSFGRITNRFDLTEGAIRYKKVNGIGTDGVVVYSTGWLDGFIRIESAVKQLNAFVAQNTWTDTVVPEGFTAPIFNLEDLTIGVRYLPLIRRLFEDIGYRVTGEIFSKPELIESFLVGQAPVWNWKTLGLLGVSTAVGTGSRRIWTEKWDGTTSTTSVSPFHRATASIVEVDGTFPYGPVTPQLSAIVGNPIGYRCFSPISTSATYVKNLYPIPETRSELSVYEVTSTFGTGKFALNANFYAMNNAKQVVGNIGNVYNNGYTTASAVNFSLFEEYSIGGFDYIAPADGDYEIEGGFLLTSIGGVAGGGDNPDGYSGFGATYTSATPSVDAEWDVRITGVNRRNPIFFVVFTENDTESFESVAQSIKDRMLPPFYTDGAIKYDPAWVTPEVENVFFDDRIKYIKELTDISTGRLLGGSYTFDGTIGLERNDRVRFGIISFHFSSEGGSLLSDNNHLGSIINNVQGESVTHCYSNVGTMYNANITAEVIGFDMTITPQLDEDISVLKQIKDKPIDIVKDFINTYNLIPYVDEYTKEVKLQQIDSLLYYEWPNKLLVDGAKETTELNPVTAYSVGYTEDEGDFFNTSLLKTRDIKLKPAIGGDTLEFVSRYSPTEVKDYIIYPDLYTPFLLTPDPTRVPVIADRESYYNNDRSFNKWYGNNTRLLTLVDTVLPAFGYLQYQEGTNTNWWALADSYATVIGYTAKDITLRAADYILKPDYVIPELLREYPLSYGTGRIVEVDEFYLTYTEYIEMLKGNTSYLLDNDPAYLLSIESYDSKSRLATLRFLVLKR